MKKVMLAAMLAISSVAFAQESLSPDGVNPPKARQGMGGPRGQMSAERGKKMPFRRMNSEVPNDPAVMAVLNSKIAKQIGLSEDVRVKIKEVDKESRKVIKDLQEKALAAKAKQAELMKAANIEEAAVMSVIDELFNLRKEMAKTQTKRLIAIKSLISPEQIEKAIAIRNEMLASRRNKSAATPKAKVKPPTPVAEVDAEEAGEESPED